MSRHPLLCQVVIVAIVPSVTYSTYTESDIIINTLDHNFYGKLVAHGFRRFLSQLPSDFLENLQLTDVKMKYSSSKVGPFDM